MRKKVSCRENHGRTVLSWAIIWRLTATEPMWRRQASCSRRARQRRRKNGHPWWNDASRGRQVLPSMQIADAGVLACLPRGTVHPPMHCARECCNHSITICLPRTAPSKVSWAQCMYMYMCSMIRLLAIVTGQSAVCVHADCVKVNVRITVKINRK